MSQDVAGEQICMFCQDTLSQKTCQVCSPAEPRPARTSASSSRKFSALSNPDYLFLDLREGGGNLLGPCWEMDSPWRSRSVTLNTGPAPRNGGAGSSLFAILMDSAPRKYYLTHIACRGILRRAAERGKKLPPQLEWALRQQAGL